MTDQDVAVAAPSDDDTSEERPDRSLAEQLVEEARADGVDLVGTGGLLAGLTKRVLEAGLEVEVDEHLGYSKHAVEGRNHGNSRNGTRAKTVLTEIGPVDIDVPRIVTAVSSRRPCAKASRVGAGFWFPTDFAPDLPLLPRLYVAHVAIIPGPILGLFVIHGALIQRPCSHRTSEIEWEDVTMFQVDERVAPSGDPDRNLTQLHATLGKAGADHSTMPVEQPNLAVATASYAAQISERFDLMHLGLGP